MFLAISAVPVSRRNFMQRWSEACTVKPQVTAVTEKQRVFVISRPTYLAIAIDQYDVIIDWVVLNWFVIHKCFIAKVTPITLVYLYFFKRRSIDGTRGSFFTPLKNAINAENMLAGVENSNLLTFERVQAD